MTPEEKAKDIYNKMKGFRVTNAHRKKCTLVAIDEIRNLDQAMSVESAMEITRFWYQVRISAEKL